MNPKNEVFNNLFSGLNFVLLELFLGVLASLILNYFAVGQQYCMVPTFLISPTHIIKTFLTVMLYYSASKSFQTLWRNPFSKEVQSCKFPVWVKTNTNMVAHCDFSRTFGRAILKSICCFNSAGNYMFKVNNRNTRTWCEI